ncbi:MAG: GxxExxY protein [Sphingobacteriaceae bacterium]|jgi:GxxExxY protein|nr:GxxExxY protein [Sphingobacteriaceae bacterium]
MLPENELAGAALDICFGIHREYGPGLFESVYEELFAYEWTKTQISFTRQECIPLIHEELKIETAFRADFIIADTIILELKSVERIAPVHFKQLQTYLKLTNLKLGLLINFNMPLLKDGIHRVANGL